MSRVEVRFTKGPWRVGNHGSVVADIPVSGINESDHDVEYYGGHVICETVAPSNSHLIAAAPGLYEALESLCLLLPMLPVDYSQDHAKSEALKMVHALEKSRQVLANARGKEL